MHGRFASFLVVVGRYSASIRIIPQRTTLPSPARASFLCQRSCCRSSTTPTTTLVTPAATTTMQASLSLEDSVTWNEDDFDDLPVVMAAAAHNSNKPRDAQPRAPSRRSTVQEWPMRLRPTILLLGDSLTEYGFGRPTIVPQQENDDSSPQPPNEIGWAGLLSAAYTRRADVLNRGFSGYNTKWCLNLIPKVFGVVDQVFFAVVWLGANDAAVPNTNCQHVPLDQYQANLTAILRLFRNRVKEQQPSNHQHFPILLLTPPPVQETAWKEYLQTNAPQALEETGGESNRQNNMARIYGDAAKKVAGTDPNCAVVDVWELLEGETEDRGQYLSDGLHLSDAGNRKVYQGIMATIRQHFPKVLPMQEGDGKYGALGSGIPVEEKLWKELGGIYQKPGENSE